jgi:DNA-binding transcriptional regulator YhcF (GntR family)
MSTTTSETDSEKAETLSSLKKAKQISRNPFARRKLIAAVRSDATVIRGAVVTLEALLDHAGDDAHPSWPSQARLAEMTHVHVSTIHRHLQELSEAGYIQIYGFKPRQNAETGKFKRKTNRYYFCTRKRDGIGRRKLRNRTQNLDSTGATRNHIVNETAASPEVGSCGSSSKLKYNDRYSRSSGKLVHPQPPRFVPNQAFELSEEERRAATPEPLARNHLSKLRQRLR